MKHFLIFFCGTQGQCHFERQNGENRRGRPNFPVGENVRRTKGARSGESDFPIIRLKHRLSIALPLILSLVSAQPCAFVSSATGSTQARFPLKRPSRAKKMKLPFLSASHVFVSLYYYDFVPPPFRGTPSSPGRLKLLACKGK